jgi:hypothetical protein
MPREIAFVDRNVDDLPTFLAGLRPELDPILLSDDEPAPSQIARTVPGRTRRNPRCRPWTGWRGELRRWRALPGKPRWTRC